MYIENKMIDDEVVFPENDIIHKISKKKQKFTNKVIKKEYLNERYDRIRDSLPLFVDLGEFAYQGYYCRPPQIIILSMMPDFKTFNVLIRYYQQDPVEKKRVSENYIHLDKVTLEEAVREARKRSTKEHLSSVRDDCPYISNPNVWESCFVDDIEIAFRPYRGTMEQLIPSYYRDLESHMEDIPNYMLKE